MRFSPLKNGVTKLRLTIQHARGYQAIRSSFLTLIIPAGTTIGL